MSGQNTNHHRLGCEPDSLVPLDCIGKILSIHHEVPTGFKTGQDYCQLVSLWTTALPFTNHRQTKLHCQSEKIAPFTAPFTVHSPPHSWNPFPFRVFKARVFPLAIECAHSPSLRKGTPLPRHKNQDHPLHGRRFVYLFESPPQHS